MNARGIIGPPRSEPVIGRVVVGALDLVAGWAERAVGPRAESAGSARRQADVKEVSPMRLAMRTQPNAAC